MQLLIDSRNIHKHQELMERVYLFRHRFFVEYMKWETIRKPDGREIDQFDYPEAIHLIGLFENRVVSYSRLLPTEKPHLLSHVYPEMLDGASAPVGSSIYEWTRCAVDPAMREGRKGADPATIGMYLGVTEACLSLGITALHVQTHPMLLTRMIELGWKCKPLALPKEYDGKPVVPIYAEVNHSTLATSRNLFSVSNNVLTIEGTENELGSSLIEPLSEKT